MIVAYLNNFLEKVDSTGDLPDLIKKAEPWFVKSILGKTQEVLEKYRHVGKLFHYESFEDKPQENSEKAGFCMGLAMVKGAPALRLRAGKLITRVGSLSQCSGVDVVKVLIFAISL